jgi:hypothetical protein
MERLFWMSSDDRLSDPYGRRAAHQPALCYGCFLDEQVSSGATYLGRQQLFRPAGLQITRIGWFAGRQLSGDEPAEADAYSLSSSPSTTCVARSVAVDSITR